MEQKELFRYFLSIGSNVTPAHNIGRILDGLLAIGAPIAMSRIIRTKAVGFSSRHDFLNLCAQLSSPLDADALKARFNVLEVSLGRDRSDPNSKMKDRPADVDILFALAAGETAVPPSLIPPEPFVRGPLLELLHFLDIACPVSTSPLTPGVALSHDGVTIGLHPTTIYQSHA